MEIGLLSGATRGKGISGKREGGSQPEEAVKRLEEKNKVFGGVGGKKRGSQEAKKQRWEPSTVRRQTGARGKKGR